MASSPFYERGRYLGRVVGQGLSESSKGTPQIVIRFKVLEFESGDPVNQQYERTVYRAITEKTMPYVTADLKVLGYTRDSFKFLDPKVQGFHSFDGQEAIFVCNHEPDLQGDLREKWGIAPAEGAAFEIKKPLEAKKLRDLDSLFGKQLREGVRSAQPEKAQTATAVVDNGPPNDFDDDVPFS